MILKDKVLFTKNIIKAVYFSDKLSHDLKGIEDIELVFEFYDKANKLLKTKSIIILASESPFELPKLTIEVTPDKDLNEGKLPA